MESCLENIMNTPLLNNTTNMHDLNKKIHKVQHLMTKMDSGQLHGGSADVMSQLATVLSKTTPHLLKDYKMALKENNELKQHVLCGGDTTSPDFFNDVVKQLTHVNDDLLTEIRKLKTENEVFKTITK